MKIYLVKTESGSYYHHFIVCKNAGGSVTRRFDVPLKPVPFDNDVGTEECCKLLQKEWDNWVKEKNLVIEFKTKPPSQNKVHLWIEKKSCTTLANVFGNDAVVTVECTWKDVTHLKTIDMPVKLERNSTSGVLNLCEDENANISKSMFEWCSTDKDQLNLSVFVNFSKLNAPFLDHDIPQKLTIFKKLLQENVLSDLEIVASNGTAIKCHKIFLAAHSPVFRTMLESQFEEGKTGKIETGIDEESIKALLEYIYGWEISIPKRNPRIAVDLLQVGHKYDIPSLEERMKQIILDTSFRKFHMDDGVKLFVFIRNLDQHNDLKMKAVRIMKSSPEEIHTSNEFNNLLKLEGNAAAEAVKELTYNILSLWKEDTKDIPE